MKISPMRIRFGVLSAVIVIPLLLFQNCTSANGNRTRFYNSASGGGTDGKVFSHYATCANQQIGVSEKIVIAKNGDSAKLIRQNCTDLGQPQLLDIRDLQFALGDKSVFQVNGQIFDEQSAANAQRVTVQFCRASAGVDNLIWQVVGNTNSYYGSITQLDGSTSNALVVQSAAPGDFVSASGQSSQFHQVTTGSSGNLTYTLGNGPQITVSSMNCSVQVLPALDDGSSGAPTGPAPFPSILAGYVSRPLWKIAGIDYATGIPAGTALKNPMTINMAGVTVDGTAATVNVSGPGVVFDAYDFSLNGGWQIYLSGASATNVTIKNSYFKVGSKNQIPIMAIYGGFANVLYNHFDGGGVAGTANSMFSAGTGAIVQYNRFTNVPVDGIIIVNDGNFTIKYNLFDSINWGAGPSEAIQTFNTSITSLNVQFNTLYQPAAGPQGWPGSFSAFIRIGEQGAGNTVRNPILANNTLLAIGATGHQGAAAAGVNMFSIGGSVVNLSLHDNFMDASGILYAVFVPTQSSLTTPVSFDNWNLVDGARVLLSQYNNQSSSPPNPPATPQLASGTVIGGNQVRLTGSGPAGMVMDVFDQSNSLIGTSTANGTGAWIWTGALPTGSYSFVVRATDIYANSSAPSNAVNVTVP